MAANPEIVEYIRKSAIARGIDPEVALRVAQAEALNVFDPNQPDRGGDEGSSFGPYQFHYAGMSKSMPNAGLGDEFTAATGLDARNPATWRQQVDYALDYASKKGWSPWMGAARVGITGMQGINGNPASDTPAATNVARADPREAEFQQAMADALALKPSEREEPRSMLANDLAASVSRKSSPTQATDQVINDQPRAQPLPEFASAGLPETPGAEMSVLGDVGGTAPALADLFKVKDIGLPNEIDPVTGQARPFRSRRMYG